MQRKKRIIRKHLHPFADLQLVHQVMRAEKTSKEKKSPRKREIPRRLQASKCRSKVITSGGVQAEPKGAGAAKIS
jgi:hypothetical protein